MPRRGTPASRLRPESQRRLPSVRRSSVTATGHVFESRQEGNRSMRGRIVRLILREWRSPGQGEGASMVASDSFAEFLREQLAPLGRLTMRRMFGKTGVFCDGVMLAMVTENTLYFRVDDQNRATFKEAESSPPLNYEKNGRTIDLSFWRAPERL